jgi:hypothetical protein
MPKQTGPTSESGRRIASQNAAKHLMTGRVLLLPGENPSDLDALVAQWQEEYPTETVEAAKLVQEAAHSEWILLRVQRQSDKNFVDLFLKGMDAWEDAEHKRYQLTQRYLTAAERKLERNRRLIWQYRRELRSEARELREAARFAGRKNDDKDEPEPEPTPKPPRICDTPIPQSAVISVENGRTVTYLNPPNETVLRAHGIRDEKTLIKREIEFDCEQIPAEYAFCVPKMAGFTGPLDQKGLVVHLTLRSFITAIEREAASGGHVQFWPDLYAQDKQFIEEALAKE